MRWPASPTPRTCPGRRFKRDYPVKDDRIGRVTVEGGALKGISGFEKKYDHLLTGQDLIYEVMVDKHNRVIEKTFNEKSKLIPGQDVHLTEEEWP